MNGVFRLLNRDNVLIVDFKTGLTVECHINVRGIFSQLNLYLNGFWNDQRPVGECKRTDRGQQDTVDRGVDNGATRCQ